MLRFAKLMLYSKCKTMNGIYVTNLSPNNQQKLHTWNVYDAVCLNYIGHMSCGHLERNSNVEMNSRKTKKNKTLDTLHNIILYNSIHSKQKIEPLLVRF